MQTFDPQFDFKIPKTAFPWLTVFSLMHRAQDGDSDIFNSATDIWGGLEQGSASRQNDDNKSNPCETFTDFPVKRTITLL